MVFIAFIRRELLNNNASDPLSDGKIACDALLDDFYQKNYPGIYYFLSQCSHFPEEDFLLLTKTHPSLVVRVMEDLRGSAWESSMLFQLAQLFPEHHETIAQTYQDTLDTAPMLPEQQAVIETQIKVLQQKSPIFLNIEPDRKIDRDQQESAQKTPFFTLKKLLQASCVAGAGVGVYTAFSPTLSPVAPIILGGAALGMASSDPRAAGLIKLSYKAVQDTLSACVEDVTENADEVLKNSVAWLSAKIGRR